MKESEVVHCGCHIKARNALDVPSLSRHRWLRATLASTTAGALASIGFAVSSTASARTVKRSGEALNALMDGNRRFVERKLTFYQEDLAILQQNTAEKQEPFASVLCFPVPTPACRWS